MSATAATHPVLRLLIVEDTLPDAELNAAMLRRAGHALSFDVANTPEAFQQRLEGNEYDLILCGHNLRSWLGTDALELLKRSGKDIPFVVVTATLGDEAAVDCIKQGAADYVLKDRLERLPLAVDRALREKAHRDDARRLQEEVFRGKEEWELTFNTVPDPVFVLDEQNRVIHTNRAAVEAFGAALPQFHGRHWCEVVNPAAHQDSDCPLARALKADDGGRFEVEVPLFARVYETSAASLRRSGGGISGLVCVMHDITQRKRSEAALRESSERFRDLFQEAPVAYHEIDRDGILRRVNRAECELLGYEQDEMAGRPVWEFVAPEQREAARESIRRKVSQESAAGTTEREFVRRDGARLTMEIHQKLILNERGNVAGIRSALLDVSERRWAEDLLRLNEQFLSSVFASIQDGVSVLDSELNIVRVNPAMERAFAGAMPLVGKKCWQAYHGRSSVCENCPSLRALQTGKATSSIMTRLGPNNQVEAWVDVHAFPLADPKTGQTVGIIEHVRNITEYRKLEEQLRQAQKMEAIGRLAGGVAHDFNNLLMVITGYSDLLLEQLGDAQRQEKSVQEIRRAANRAAGLTRQLLAFSRKQILQPQVLDLNSVVTNIDKMLRRLIGEDIELAVRLWPALAHVKADPGQIEQVILNLAVNSRDAMPEGGKLSIETANVELDEAYAGRHAGMQAGSFAILAITDTGCGMDSAILAHIFEPFYTTKEKGKGTGLGLATAYGIVKQSGGFIWVYSEPGKGTTFKIYLPQVEEPLENRKVEEPSAQSSQGTETILLVEDDEKVRDLIREALAQKGYSVMVAPDGDEAVLLTRNHDGDLDLIITDVIMPRMSGRQLAAVINSIRPGTRFLFISGYTGNVIVDHGILGENLPFLQKPFAASVLCRKVRELLDQRPAAGRTGTGPADS